MTYRNPERSCARKQRYPSQRTARLHIRYRLRHGDRSYLGTHAYRCDHCGGWHVGHASVWRAVA